MMSIVIVGVSVQRKGSNLDLTYKEFNYHDYHKKPMHLPGEEFLRRFLLHVLPKGFMRIRHYGYLASRVRVKQLEKIRKCLDMTKIIVVEPTKSGYSPTTQAGSSPPDTLNAQAPEHCPKCKIGFLRLIGEIASECERRRYGELM